MRQKTKKKTINSDKLQLLPTLYRSNTQNLRKEMYIIKNINLIALFHIPFLKKRLHCFQTRCPPSLTRGEKACCCKLQSPVLPCPVLLRNTVHVLKL